MTWVMEYGNVIMYVEERVSTGRILLIRPRKCQGAKPYKAHGALWRETVTVIDKSAEIDKNKEEAYKVFID